MKMTTMSELNCSNESGRMNNVRLTALFYHFKQAENTKLCKIQIELILTQHHTFQTNFNYLIQRLNNQAILFSSMARTHLRPHLLKHPRKS